MSASFSFLDKKLALDAIEWCTELANSSFSLSSTSLFPSYSFGIMFGDFSNTQVSNASNVDVDILVFDNNS